ncbi:MAG: hypothetical protein KAG06_06365, partial [Methylococcales bacterium]|nr:hypothetical protein [Methylococcales bacterium]
MTKNKLYLSCLFIGMMTLNLSYAKGSSWSSKGVVASTHFKNGISIAIVYPTEFSCHKALFGIVGSASINTMKLFIDGQAFNQINPASKTIEGVTYSGFKLSKNGLASLKKGTLLQIKSNIGDLTVSLAGVAKAFDAAWKNCEVLV